MQLNNPFCHKLFLAPCISCSKDPRLHTFQSILQNATMRLRDTGILNRIIYDIFADPVQIKDSRVRNKLPLTVQQLNSTMVAILVGLTLSVMVFIFERFLAGKLSGLKLAEEIIELD